jgi:hypothetical protein
MCANTEGSAPIGLRLTRWSAMCRRRVGLRQKRGATTCSSSRRRVRSSLHAVPMPHRGRGRARGRRHGESLSALREQGAASPRLCIMAMDQALAAAEMALDAEDPWTGLGRRVTHVRRFPVGCARAAGREDRGDFRDAGDEPTGAPAPGHDRRTGASAGNAAARGNAPGRRSADRAVRAPRDGATAVDDDNVRDGLGAIASDGPRADHPEPLPGTPPTTVDYQRRAGDPTARGGT